jgi:hypothetical protein
VRMAVVVLQLLLREARLARQAAEVCVLWLLGLFCPVSQAVELQIGWA